MPWLYEPHTFVLDEESGHLREAFTPDFYLPELDRYVELTTLRQAHVTAKNRKLRRLRALYPNVDVRVLYRRDCRNLLGYGESAELRPHVLIPRARLHRRVAEIAHMISRDYQRRDVVLLGVAEGALFFLADLARRMEIPARVQTITPRTRDVSLPPRSHVVIVDDLVNTGLTLFRVRQLAMAAGALSVRSAVLLDQPARRLVSAPIDYPGFKIPDVRVVGYGGDYDGAYRLLSHVAAL